MNISPLMFIFLCDENKKLPQIFLFKENYVYLDIQICRENHDLISKIPHIHLTIKYPLICFLLDIKINNLIARKDSEEYIIKSFNIKPESKEIFNKDEIKIKDFLKIDSHNEYLIVNLKFKKEQKFLNNDLKKLKVSIKSLICNKLKKHTFHIISSNIMINENNWISISFKIEEKHKAKAEIYNILKSFNGLISIKIKTTKDILLANYKISLNYTSYNVFYMDISD